MLSSEQGGSIERVLLDALDSFQLRHAVRGTAGVSRILGA
jgi:hypothetical protein